MLYLLGACLREVRRALIKEEGGKKGEQREGGRGVEWETSRQAWTDTVRLARIGP